MARQRLTAQRVATAKADEGSRLEIRDADVPGLELRVTARQHKSWYFHYTRTFDQKRRRVLMGTYPAMSLKEARRKAIALRGEVESGADPAAEKKARKTAMTFRELANLRLELDQSITPATKTQYRQALDTDIFKRIGHMPANEITADMIARILDEVEGRGAAVHADRVRSAIGSTFKWAVKRRQAGVIADPTAGLGKRAPSVPRLRILSDEELRRLWVGVENSDSPLTPAMQLIVKLAVLTGQRRTEVCGARKTELDLNAVIPTWVIPGDRREAGRIIHGRMKNRRDQRVPLSRQALQLWKQALSFAGDSDYVFPARAHNATFPHIRPDSVTQATRRVCAAVGLTDTHLHDMRRCIATWCGNQGVRREVIDRILSHAPRDVTGRHYNFAVMDDLVLGALQAWADHVDQVVCLHEAERT